MIETIRLGVMPLTDAAPLVVAQAKGFFANEKLDVHLTLEQSWATIRDKVMFHALDGALMLAPMPLAMSLGVGHKPRQTLAPMVLSLNGNGITIGSPLLREIADTDPQSLAERPIRAGGLAKVVAARRAAGRGKLTFGVVFPVSSHLIQLRWWLQDGGIDPDRDVEIEIVPPAQMAGQLEAGLLDGYCVGEPWNQLAVRAGLGHLLITSYELWSNGAEKVLGVSGRFADERPEALQALLRALIGASAWLDRAENRLEAAKLLVEGGWVEAPIETVGLSLAGIVADGLEGGSRPLPDMHVFSRYAANFPWLSHARIFAEAMAAMGQIPATPPDERLAEIFRPDLFRNAAKAMGIPVPAADEKDEGIHGTDWIMAGTDGPVLMGPTRFFDGRGLSGSDRNKNSA